MQTPVQQQYGPGDYVPNVFIQYWSMRVMAYTAGLLFLFSLWGLWLLRRKNASARRRWFLRVAVWAAVLPFMMNTAGWVLTENGRQPWIVQGIQLTRDGVSPSVSTRDGRHQPHRVLPALRRPRRWSTFVLMPATRAGDQPAPAPRTTSPRSSRP